MIIEFFPAAERPTAGATLFFAGWGMDANPFRSAFPADRDCLVCHSYTDLDFDPSRLDGYDDVVVVAWSLGVWAAGRVMARHRLRPGLAVAVNGTMHPVDDDRGIPRDVFAATLAGLTPASLAKFRRRMCATRDAYRAFAAAPPARDFADVRDELRAIADALGPDAPAARWDGAVVGTADRIFPVAAQRLAWRGTRVLEVPDGHYLSCWRALFAGGALP